MRSLRCCFLFSRLACADIMQPLTVNRSRSSAPSRSAKATKRSSGASGRNTSIRGSLRNSSWQSVCFFRTLRVISSKFVRHHLCLSLLQSPPSLHYHIFCPIVWTRIAQYHKQCISVTSCIGIIDHSSTYLDFRCSSSKDAEKSALLRRLILRNMRRGLT